MKPGLRNFLAILAGIVVGGAVNMMIINYSSNVIPLPEGVIPEDMESLKANIHRFEAKHYIMPFLAHALGTLVGAFVAVKLAIRRKRFVGMFMGVWFLLGGIAAAIMIGTPFLPSMVDLLFAYLPMAWIGHKLAR